ncbi:hypothetical protein [Roseomonas indoligenes]|uniref:Uncharacterized protein n=1 Tax=Roseomonas indoligenes TaxID=2820811 RepID=A0A940S476_9PROT|nr:hypothetical protein [Pararoseomonas indoligenes]MBP0491710.1 hypothetical protein [Pararoseomonas indoligenes]
MIAVTHPAQDGFSLPLPGPAPGALLFRPGPGLAPEAHRVARALLEDAARNRGGRVSSAEDGTWRLVAAPPALEMARRALSAVLNGRDAVLVTEALAAPVPAAPVPAGTGPEAILSALPLETLIERRDILGFGRGGAPRPAGMRVRPSAPAIAAALGPRWAGAPWQAHGWGLVARRALVLPEPAEGLLHLDLPPEALPAESLSWRLPVLPPPALASPPGCRFGVDGPSQAVLALLDPAALPGAALHLAWDPALTLLPAGFWGAIGPGRVVLEGVTDTAGLEWGLARGIGRFAGPKVDGLLAALRRARG